MTFKSKGATRRLAKSDTPLTMEESIFAMEYVSCGVAIDAWCKATKREKELEPRGYINASEMLHKPRVAALIQELRAVTNAELVATMLERKEFLTKAVRGDFGKGQATFADRVKAVDLLNKIEAVYVEKTESNEKRTVEVIIRRDERPMPIVVDVQKEALGNGE